MPRPHAHNPRRPPPHLIQTRREDFLDLASRVIRCGACPRLRAHCREIARVKKRMFRDRTYWGKPAPGFGDPRARLLIIGLAPAAHGANRTGRVFTGDDSGNWLYRELYHFGWSNLEDSAGPGDGLRLTGVYVTATARCAPPANKPTAAEITNCRPFLMEEIRLLRTVSVVLALGRIAFDGYLRTLREMGEAWPGERPRFGHARLHPHPEGRRPVLVSSYHPSRQNTNTGRLTRSMWRAVFRLCAKHM